MSKNYSTIYETNNIKKINDNYNNNMNNSNMNNSNNDYDNVNNSIVMSHVSNS